MSLESILESTESWCRLNISRQTVPHRRTNNNVILDRRIKILLDAEIRYGHLLRVRTMTCSLSCSSNGSVAEQHDRDWTMNT